MKKPMVEKLMHIPNTYILQSIDFGRKIHNHCHLKFKVAGWVLDMKKCEILDGERWRKIEAKKSRETVTLIVVACYLYKYTHTHYIVRNPRMFS